MLEDLVGHVIVVDLRSPFVCLGMLESVTEQYLCLRDADLHDLRDSDTSRENYVAASHMTGIKRNRKRVLLARSEIVALARFADVVDE